MMDRRKGDDRGNAREIILTRSEPLVNLKKLREISGFNLAQNSLYKRDNGMSFSSSQKMVHPPTTARSKLTIVSPKRRVRIPQPAPLPMYNFPRSNADGESAYSTDDEKVLKIRVPGDGCNSDSELDNTESDLSFLRSDSTIGVDSFNAVGFEFEANKGEGILEKENEVEYYSVDIDETDFENDLWDGEEFNFS